MHDAINARRANEKPRFSTGFSPCVDDELSPMPPMTPPTTAPTGRDGFEDVSEAGDGDVVAVEVGTGPCKTTAVCVVVFVTALPSEVDVITLVVEARYVIVVFTLSQRCTVYPLYSMPTYTPRAHSGAVDSLLHDLKVNTNSGQNG